MQEEKTQTMKNIEKDGTESLVSETVASLKGIPKREDLKLLLAQNVLTVDFTKLNGDKRVMTCTLREDIKPAVAKSGSQKAARGTSDAVVSVWDVNAQGWRSFRYERINSVDIVDEYDNSWFSSSSK